MIAYLLENNGKKSELLLPSRAITHLKKKFSLYYLLFFNQNKNSPQGIYIVNEVSKILRNIVKL
jgi:hypothetical protein